ATSVDVERVFSRGRLLLSHVWNRLSAQSTRALMCLAPGVCWDSSRMRMLRLRPFWRTCRRERMVKIRRSLSLRMVTRMSTCCNELHHNLQFVICLGLYPRPYCRKYCG
ncbi:hypothetical protein B0H13DRAFT_1592206, partial [Mycena leptocephala]